MNNKDDEEVEIDEETLYLALAKGMMFLIFYGISTIVYDFAIGMKSKVFYVIAGIFAVSAIIVIIDIWRKLK